MASQTMLASKMTTFTGLKANSKMNSTRAVQAPMTRSRRSVKVSAEAFLGSAPNLIMVASTGLVLAAGRFGLVASTNRYAPKGIKLVERPSGLKTGDPSGFNVVDVLALGAVGHFIGVGTVLGLQATGAI